MKLSYSTRWLVCWALFVIALLTIIAGVFSFSTSWRQGLGITLVGLGLAGPTLWWLRKSSRQTPAPLMKRGAALAALVVGGGLIFLPWKNVPATVGNDEVTQGRDEITAPETQVPSDASQANTTTEEAPLPTPTSADEPPEAERSPGPVVTVTEVETTVQTETGIPSRVTIFSQLPPIPAPQQSAEPSEPEQSTTIETPPTTTPSEPPAQAEATITTSTSPEDGNLEPEGQQLEDEPASRGAEQRGRNYATENEASQSPPELGALTPPRHRPAESIEEETQRGDRLMK